MTKKYKIDETIPRTPEERKWVESELSKERTPEELKKEILGEGSGNVAWNLYFNKKMGAKLATCVWEPEIYFKQDCIENLRINLSKEITPLRVSK